MPGLAFLGPPKVVEEESRRFDVILCYDIRPPLLICYGFPTLLGCAEIWTIYKINKGERLEHKQHPVFTPVLLEMSLWSLV